MKASFAILVWQNQAGRDRANGFIAWVGAGALIVARGEKFVVLARDDRAQIEDAARAIFLGTVSGSVPHMTHGDPLRYCRDLVANAWGSYTVLVSDGDQYHAMVDPSGAGRAYIARDPDLVMLTDMLTPDLMRRAGFRIQVDTAALAGCLLDPGTMVTAPLLDGVSAMVPGTLYELAHSGRTVEIWSPSMVHHLEPGDGRDLRTAVDRTMQTMVANRQPLVELSGGLDSSIVAGTMVALGMRPSAVTVTMMGGDVDELRYAEATAMHCGVALHRGRTATYPRYESFMEAEQVAHPYMYGVDDAFAAVVGEAITTDVECIITGQGGDAVFFQPATPLTTIDGFRVSGLRSGWGALLDDARRTRASIWHHLVPVVKDRIHSAGPPQDALAEALYTKDAREGRRRFVHPWCAGADHLPPGRQLQILMLANSQIFHSARPVDLGRPLLHPLLAQPVLEAALAIPTWRLSSGPIDRGLARRVFADRLHPDIARRRSKGEAAAFYSRTALANLPYLRERLLGGALVKAGIIDPVTMERVLTPDYLFYSLDYRSLILQAACEAWLATWTD